MILMVAALAGLGLVCVLSKRTLPGILIGVQLLTMGASLLFGLVGAVSSSRAGEGVQLQGHLYGFFITLAGVGPLVVGFALASRLFYQRDRVDMKELRSLKH